MSRKPAATRRTRRHDGAADISANEGVRALVRSLRLAFGMARTASAEAVRLEALAEDAKRVSAEADRRVTITRTELLEAIGRGVAEP